MRESERHCSLWDCEVGHDLVMEQQTNNLRNFCNFIREKTKLVFQQYTVDEFIYCCCSLSCIQLFATPYPRQASLSFTISWSLLKLMSMESVMPSNHLILCRCLLLRPSVFPSTGLFSSESVLHLRSPKYRNFSFSISPSSDIQG